MQRLLQGLKEHKSNNYVYFRDQSGRAGATSARGLSRDSVPSIRLIETNAALAD
jgi:hypothetical protein